MQIEPVRCTVTTDIFPIAETYIDLSSFWCPSVEATAQTIASAGLHLCYLCLDPHIYESPHLILMFSKKPGWQRSMLHRSIFFAH